MKVLTIAGRSVEVVALPLIFDQLREARRSPSAEDLLRLVKVYNYVAPERFKLKLLAYECQTEGTKLVELDRTETFTRLCFRPRIRVAAGGEATDVVETRVRRAPKAAQKYSLVANSVKSELVIEPEITIVSE
jgi:hypothetical protein